MKEWYISFTFIHPKRETREFEATYFSCGGHPCSRENIADCRSHCRTNSSLQGYTGTLTILNVYCVD